MGIGIPESGASGPDNEPKGSKFELEVGLRRGDVNSAGICLLNDWIGVDEAAGTIVCYCGESRMAHVDQRQVDKR